jgi:hypothetical protein
MLRDIDSVLEIEYEPKSVVDLTCNSRTLRLYKHGTGGCHDQAVQTLRYPFFTDWSKQAVKPPLDLCLPLSPLASMIFLFLFEELFPPIFK